MNIDVELIEKVVKKVLNDVETGSFMSMPSAKAGSKTLWRVCEKPQGTFFSLATRMISGTRGSLQK